MIWVFEGKDNYFEANSGCIIYVLFQCQTQTTMNNPFVRSVPTYYALEDEAIDDDAQNFDPADTVGKYDDYFEISANIDDPV